MKKIVRHTAKFRKTALAAAFVTSFLPFSSSAFAATFVVTDFTDGASGGLAGTGAGNAGDLRSAILAANASAGIDTIQFACGAPSCVITLSGPLPPITDDLTIDGGTLGDIVVDGAGSYRAFFVDTGTVALSNLQIRNAKAIGGAGGNIGGNGGGGGGGAGLGAGLFVNRATANVTVTNVAFANNSVVGGAGGVAGNNNWGGGGMAFAGGTSTTNGGGGGGGPAAGGTLGAGISGGTGARSGGGGAAAGPDIFVRLGTLATIGSTSIGPAAAGGAGAAMPPHPWPARLWLPMFQAASRQY